MQSTNFTGPGRSLARAARRLSLVASVALLPGCSMDGLLRNGELPPDVTDPAIAKNPEGAAAAYNAAQALFSRAFGDKFTGATGLLTDELQPGRGIRASLWEDDTRRLPEREAPGGSSVSADAYMLIQRARGQTNQAIGLVRDFGRATQQPLLAHLYALQGYSTVFLAELFCSGIPLSTLDYEGDYTLKPGSSTQDALAHAVALFDTALTLAGDSARFAHLARVGRARALLALDSVAQAAATAAEVPDGYRYTRGLPDGNNPDGISSFAWVDAASGAWQFMVSNGEGGNGLDYIASGDPRTAVAQQGTTEGGQPLYHPTKYDPSGTTPMVLADWVEARLIQAEAALRAGDANWLEQLNQLRRTAISPALPDTTDPGTPEARVDLLFRERAFWLFLTGHRQGDLRRLVRQYGRSAQDVYPSGPYPRGGFYGTDVTAPVPSEERILNPQFTGCISRGA